MFSIPLIIAHRGASRDAPENTLAAFRLAWEQGADGIEADFRLTRDGRIVCLHDASTARTTGVDLRVDSSSLSELNSLDAGGWKGRQWAGERIPTLDEVIAALPAGKRLFVELKCGPEIIPPLAAVLAGSGIAVEQVVLLSFSAQLVGLLKEHLPDCRACWLSESRRNWLTSDPTPAHERIIATLRGSGADGLACRAGRFLDERLAEALREAGLELHVWTVDAPAAARRFAALGVASIFTNRPGWLRERLGGSNT
ncbi:MAG: glycerophosphodiester phosphodiesterase [Deltaproteobacteria bacterium]|nr:glycerophosphodiester phosphodiesterase [Deltaproteobacteria bacterium]